MRGGSDGYWGLMNPAFFWLFFVPPFLFYGMGVSLANFWAVPVTVLAIYLLFRQPDRPFRLAFYLLPLFALFCSYVLSPLNAFLAMALADIWVNLSVFFAHGKSRERIFQSLSSARLLGFFILVYLAILLLLGGSYSSNYRLFFGWIPALIPIVVYAIKVCESYVSPKPREVISYLPSVRVAVVRGDKLLLREDASGVYDIPFTFSVHPGDVPYDVAESRMRQVTRLRPKFLLKYKHTVRDNAESVVYLFVLNLRHSDPFDIDFCNNRNCHFVSPAEKIQLTLTKQLLEEYDYLSSTIFLTNSMLSRLK